jgi:anti-sigma factor RsiW
MSAMDCQDTFGLLSADVDGELNAVQAERVARHVAGCADCARKQALLMETRRAFQGISRPVVSAAFDDGVRRRLRRPPLRRLWLAAAAAIVVVVASSVLREPRPPARPEVDDMTAVADPQVGLDCGLPNAQVCVADTATLVLAHPNVAFTASH